MSPSARLRLYVLGALYAAPYAVMFYFSLAHHYKPRSVAALLATAVLLSLLLAGCTRTWRRFFLAYVPLLLASVAYAVYALAYGVVPGRTLGILLLSASWEEIRGLFALWPQKWLLLPFLAVLGGYLWLAWRLPEWPIFSGRSNLVARVLLALSLPLTAYAATDATLLIEGFGLNPAAGSIMFFAGQLPRARAEIHGANVVKIPFHAVHITRGEEVHVLIVGESARRGDWSVYGYRRATTPYLDRIRGETILLKDVMADANLTQLSVPMILTGIAPQDFGSTHIHGTLLDLAKEAGYSTTWLVNQDLDVSTSLGISADHLEYPPEMLLGRFGRHTRDEALLPAYRRELARSGSARFIGMHIMESHWEYYRRYPPSFRRFGSADALNSMSLFTRSATSNQQIVDSYDNSVLYGDWFLEQVIEAARTLNVPVTVTFIPDHGESLALFDGNAGHGGTVYDPAQFQIPAFIWLNTAYRAAHPGKVAALTRNSDKEIRSHDFFYTVADLMGISWPAARPERSFASDRFVPDTSLQHIMGGVLQSRPQVPAAAADAHLY